MIIRRLFDKMLRNEKSMLQSHRCMNAKSKTNLKFLLIIKRDELREFRLTAVGEQN
jgi:hypothetical protein